MGEVFDQQLPMVTKFHKALSETNFRQSGKQGERSPEKLKRTS